MALGDGFSDSVGSDAAVFAAVFFVGVHDDERVVLVRIVEHEAEAVRMMQFHSVPEPGDLRWWNRLNLEERKGIKLYIEEY